MHFALPHKHWIILFLAVLYLPRPSLAATDGIEKNTQAIWYAPAETSREKTALLAPRIVLRPFEDVLSSKTLARLGNTGKSLVMGIHGAYDRSPAELECAGYVSAEGILNPAAAFVDLVSDVATILKSPTYATDRFSDRIQVCTANLLTENTDSLTIYQQFNPMEHIATMIDGGVYETRDPLLGGDLSFSKSKGGILCRATPIKSNETESIAIERLQCVDRHYRDYFDYDWLLANCGTFTYDILEAAGLDFPDFPNIGLGTFFRTEQKNRSQSMALVKASCDVHVSNVRKIISSVANNTPIEQSVKDELMEGLLSSDLEFQLAISAAKSTNEENKAFVKKLLKHSFADIYFDDLLKARDANAIDTKRIKFLKNLFGKLDDTQTTWLKENFPNVLEIYNTIILPEEKPASPAPPEEFY